MKPLIIDYGVGNIASVFHAVKRGNADVIISDKPADLSKASHVILPGVGYFEKAMNLLIAGGWIDALSNDVVKHQVPLLGVCLGMQLLALSSDESFSGSEVQGLGYIDGHVKKLIPLDAKERIPHVGWNEVKFDSENSIFKGIENSSDFYFVHSYHFKVAESACSLATTSYCGNFSSVVGKDNIIGAQCHPEKSSKAGFRFLQNFLSMR